MNSKQLYEALGAVADQLSRDWRDQYAELIRELLAQSPNHTTATRRWLYDAGYEPPRD